jgi:hypothetical protein
MAAAHTPVLRLSKPDAYPPFMIGRPRDEIEYLLNTFLKPVGLDDLTPYANDRLGLLYVEIVGTELLYQVKLLGVDGAQYVFESVPKGAMLVTRVATARDPDTYRWFVGKPGLSRPARAADSEDLEGSAGVTEDLFESYDRLERGMKYRQKEQERRAMKQLQLARAGRTQVEVHLIRPDGYDEQLVVEVPVDASPDVIDRAVRAVHPTALRVGSPAMHMFTV